MESIELNLNLSRSGINLRILKTKFPRDGAAGRSAPQLVKSTPVNTISLKPFPTRRFICSTITPAGLDLELPRP